jgi:hypothetical protein
MAAVGSSNTQIRQLGARLVLVLLRVVIAARRCAEHARSTVACASQAPRGSLPRSRDGIGADRGAVARSTVCGFAEAKSEADDPFATIAITASTLSATSRSGGAAVAKEDRPADVAGCASRVPEEPYGSSHKRTVTATGRPAVDDAACRYAASDVTPSRQERRHRPGRRSRDRKRGVAIVRAGLRGRVLRRQRDRRFSPPARANAIARSSHSGTATDAPFDRNRAGRSVAVAWSHPPVSCAR